MFYVKLKPEKSGSALISSIFFSQETGIVERFFARAWRPMADNE